MKYPHGTLIWVKCDDGCWWPAKVRDVDVEMIRVLDQPVAFCVEFYHDPNQLYPILSSDLDSIRFFHPDFSSRSREEGPWFSNPATRHAVDQALRDASASLNTSERQNPAQDLTENSTDPLGPHEQAGEGWITSFSESELRNIRLLISAVGGETAERLRETLSRSGLEVHTGRSRRRRRQEAAGPWPSRPRAAAPTSLDGPRRFHDNDLDAKPRPTEVNFPTAVTSRAGDGMAGDKAGVVQRGFCKRKEAQFVVPLRSDVLNVLRSEVFENPTQFVLSPVYRFIELLGAVEVDNHPVVCRLPSPRALREPPPGGFASNRRVLLVPLAGENYLDSSCWMVPVVVEGRTLSMILRVNGVVTSTPPNWNLTAGKEADSIKTSPVADITHLVMPQEDDLFVLEIDFTWIPEDTFLWSGIVACIFVEETPLATICEQIVRNYSGDANGGVGNALSRNRSTPRDAVRVTEVSVKVTCPLTALPMVIPVRTLTCAHMQCMELEAILVRFTQSNLWNCPLCGAPARLHEIRVNYRLKEWLDIHRKEIDRVDYIIETPLGKQLRVQWREATIKDTYCIED